MARTNYTDRLRNKYDIETLLNDDGKWNVVFYPDKPANGQLIGTPVREPDIVNPDGTTTPGRAIDFPTEQEARERAELEIDNLVPIRQP